MSDSAETPAPKKFIFLEVGEEQIEISSLQKSLDDMIEAFFFRNDCLSMAAANGIHPVWRLKNALQQLQKPQ